jgi:hypothetical protein
MPIQWFEADAELQIPFQGIHDGISESTLDMLPPQNRGLRSEQIKIITSYQE